MTKETGMTKEAGMTKAAGMMVAKCRTTGRMSRVYLTRTTGQWA